MVTITISQDQTKLAVKPVGYDVNVNQVMGTVTGKRWYKPHGCWHCPFSQEALETLKSLLSQVTDVQVDQHVVDLLNKQGERARSVIELKSSANAVELPAELTFSTEPFQHQKVAISLGIKNKTFAYFMEMGTGKTKVMLDIIGYFLPRMREVKRPVLVICPVSVMHNWKKQASIHRPELKVKILGGSTEDKMTGLLHDADVYVVNYESAWRIANALTEIRWGIMVLDESTRIKSRATKQAKAILKLGETSSRRYILTGTPAPNSPLELFNQIRFLDRSIFSDNWYHYRDRYCIMGGYGGYQILGYKNLEELSKKISGISYRVLKSECLDLPDKLYKQYRLPMAETQGSVYKQLAEELVADINGTEIRTEVVLAKLTKLRQIASGFVYFPDGRTHSFDNNPKLEKLREIIEEGSKTHKIVVWTTFKEEEEIVTRLLEELKVEFRVLGSTTTRHLRIQEFQENKDVRVFVSNQRSGGIGIDLYAADLCIFFSNDYSPEIRLQAEDRLHRIGQHNHVTYVDLICKGSIDSTIMHMLSKKQDLSSQIMSGRIRLKEIVNVGGDTEF